MSTAVISGLIGAAAATLMASYFGNKPSEFSPLTGRRRLYYAFGLRVLIDLIVVILAILTVRTIFDQPDDISLHIFLILFTLIAGGFLILETHFSSIEFDDDGIFVISPWRPNGEISWVDFDSIRQRSFFSMHMIRTKTNGKIYVYDAMSGARELVDRAKWQARRNEFG